MSITPTTLLDARVLAIGGADGGNGNYTSATFNVAAGSTLVALMRYDFQKQGSTAHVANIPTLVTAGITWTIPPGCSVDPGTEFTACAVLYVADAPSALTGVSISQTSTGVEPWASGVSAIDATVIQLVGAAPAASIVGAILATPSISGSARDPGTVSGTLSAAPDTASYVYDIMAMDSNPSATGGSAGSGFTLLSSFAAGNPNPYLHSLVQYRTGSALTTVAWTSTVTGSNVYDYSRLAVELKAASAGGTFTGKIAATQADNVADLNGTVVNPTITGTIAAAQANNTATITGTVSAPSTVTGIIHPTQADQSADLNGTVQNFFTGLIHPNQADNVADLNGTYTPAPITGLLHPTQADNVADLTGRAGTVRYPASVSGRHLLDQFGDIIKIKTLSCWGMVQNLSLANLDDFLDNAAANGYNSITIAMFGGHYGSDWNRYQDAAGNNAWTGTPWASSLGSAWDTVTTIIDSCAVRNMFVNASLYTGFSSDQGIVADLTAVTGAQAQQAGTDIATLFLGRPNVVWHIGIDSGTYPKTNIDRFFQGVKSVEGNARLLWYEPDNSSSSDSMGLGDPNNGWTYALRSMNSRYTLGGNSTEDTDTVYAQTSEPLIDCEPPYVGAGHYTSSSGNPNATEMQQLRERKYCGFFRDECGVQDGHEMIWPFGKTGLFAVSGVTWSNALGTAPMQYFAYANTFMDTYTDDPGWTPDSSWVTTGLSSGDGKAGAGGSGLIYAAYFPSSRSVTIDTTKVSGTSNVRIRWYDPVANTYSTVASSEAQQTGRSVTYPTPAARPTAPSGGSDTTTDMILLVESTDRVATIAATQADNVADLNGTVANTFTGLIHPTQADQTADLNGTVVNPVFTGSIAAVQDAQTADLNGTYTPPPTTGTIQAHQDDNVADLNGSAPSTGTIAATQADNVADLTGVVSAPGTNTGTIHSTQSDNVADLNGTYVSASVGALGVTQDDNIAEINGTFTLATVTGTIAATQADQTANIDGQVIAPGTFTATLQGVNEDQISDLNGTTTAPVFTGTLDLQQANNVADLNGHVSDTAIAIPGKMTITWRGAEASVDWE